MRIERHDNCAGIKTQGGRLDNTSGSLAAQAALPVSRAAARPRLRECANLNMIHGRLRCAGGG